MYVNVRTKANERRRLFNAKHSELCQWNSSYHKYWKCAWWKTVRWKGTTGKANEAVAYVTVCRCVCVCWCILTDAMRVISSSLHHFWWFSCRCLRVILRIKKRKNEMCAQKTHSTRERERQKKNKIIVWNSYVYIRFIGCYVDMAKEKLEIFKCTTTHLFGLYSLSQGAFDEGIWRAQNSKGYFTNRISTIERKQSNWIKKK